MKRGQPKTEDMFTRLKKIQRIFRCFECKYQFVATQHVAVQDDDIVTCPKCGRRV